MLIKNIKKLLYLFFLIYSANILSGTHTVTNTSNSGVGSLRQAILDANGDPTTPRNIVFAILGPGPYIITPAAPELELPHLMVDQIIIDGSTQPGWTSGNPVIVIDGTNAGFGFDGLTIESSDNCVINDLVINNGFNSGITITGGSNNNAVYGCFLGTNQAGTASSPNSLGITISAENPDVNNNNIVGAPDLGRARGNLLSGNAGFFGAGMIVTGNINGTVIQNNKVGTDITGTVAVPNVQAGIALASIPSSATVLISGTQIGGLGDEEGNIISGNGPAAEGAAPGIAMVFQNIENTTIQGNKIGVDITGDNALPNQLGIIYFTDIATTLEGTIIENNIISENLFGGIGFDINTNNSIIRGNLIGTDSTGMLGRGNGGTGVSISGVGNMIESNVISDNDGSGISLQAGTSGTEIKGNFIGTNLGGTALLGNGNNGIDSQGASGFPSENNTIGGIGAERNIISGNNSSGILLNLDCNQNFIRGNIIGSDVTGTLDFGNGNNGIQIQGADGRPSNGNIIGGNAAGQGNLISANGNDGIQLNTNVNGTIIIGNRIGTNLAGDAALGNTGPGIQILGNIFPCNNSIIQNNLVSANGNTGIYLNTDVSDSIIQGNLIGTDITGTQPLGNVFIGIQISSDSDNTTIGGSGDGEGNIISANGSHGIQLQNDINDTVIHGNFIGTDITGDIDLGNNNHGIDISDAGTTNNLVGGLNDGEENIIKFNGQNGVFVNNDAELNPILRNPIYANTNNGIELNANGNNEQEAPTVNSAVFCPSNNTLTVAIIAPSAPLASTFRIEIFINSVDRNPITEGELFIGAVNADTNETVTVSFVVAPSAVGQYVSATATNFNNPDGPDGLGDTSEFSLNEEITESTLNITLAADPEDICQGGSSDLTATFSGGTAPYRLTSSDGLVQPGATSPVVREVTPATTTTYFIIVTDDTGCSATSNSVTVTVPFAELEASSTEICIGESVTLTATFGEVPPFTLTWSDGLVQAGVTSPIIREVSPTVDTDYFYTLTDGAGCITQSNIVSIEVNPLPTVTLDVPDPAVICSGTSSTLTANITGTPPFNLFWSDGFVQIGEDSNIVEREVAPGSTTTYSVIVTDVNGCQSAESNEVTVIVNPSPQVVITANPERIVLDESATLTATISSGTAPFTIEWSTGDIETGPGPEFELVVTPEETTTYSAIVTDANGCQSQSNEIVVTVGPRCDVAVSSPLTCAIIDKYCSV